MPIGTTCGMAWGQGLHPELVVSADLVRSKPFSDASSGRSLRVRDPKAARWVFGTRRGGRMSCSFSCSRNRAVPEDI